MDKRCVDRYEILETLLISGPQAIHLARDQETRRLVNLETFPREIFSSRGRAERWLEQARMLRHIRHPNLVPVLDADFNGCFYLAREWIAGQALSALIDSRWPFDRIQVAQIGAAVAEGLACLHQNGRLHGAVCPENVLLGTDGEVLLTGLGSLLAPDTHEEYLAPEVAAGAPPRAAADLYSLGILLKRLNDEAVAARDAGAHALPDGLNALIHTLTSPEPSVRPASAAVVAQTLHALARRAAAPPAPQAEDEDELIDFTELAAQWNLPLITMTPPRIEEEAPVRPARPAGRRRRMLGIAVLVAVGLSASGAVLLREHAYRFLQQRPAGPAAADADRSSLRMR